MKTKKLKKIKYRVSGKDIIADLQKNDIIEGYVVFREGATSLVYLPADSHGFCGSLSFCRENQYGEYEAHRRPNDCYVNIEKQRDLNKIIDVLKSLDYKKTKAIRPDE